MEMTLTTTDEVSLHLSFMGCLKITHEKVCDHQQGLASQPTFLIRQHSMDVIETAIVSRNVPCTPSFLARTATRCHKECDFGHRCVITTNRYHNMKNRCCALPSNKLPTHVNIYRYNTLPRRAETQSHSLTLKMHNAGTVRSTNISDTDKSTFAASPHKSQQVSMMTSIPSSRPAALSRDLIVPHGFTASRFHLANPLVHFAEPLAHQSTTDNIKNMCRQRHMECALAGNEPEVRDQIDTSPSERSNSTIETNMHALFLSVAKTS